MAIKEVLIVEDDAFLLNIIKSKLEAEGYGVLLAQDGLAALEAVRKTKPSLILLDLMLPKKSGFEFLEEISRGYAENHRSR
jgi:DNA-binding response OmpR family regulator